MTRVVFCHRCREAVAFDSTWALGDEARVCVGCMGAAIAAVVPFAEPMPAAILLHRLFHATTPSPACSLCWGSAGAAA